MMNFARKHFPAEVVTGSAQKMRQNKELERYSDPVGTECALVMGAQPCASK